MPLVLLGLIVGVVPEIWVATRGLDEVACNADALAAALRIQRPGVAVHVWQPEEGTGQPPQGATRVQLALRDGALLLEVTGAGRPIARALPATEGCERNIETAALIVDGALDDLRGSEARLSVDSLAPPVPFRKQLHLAGSVGVGVEQGMFSLVPVFDVAGIARYRAFELTLDADLGLASSTGFSLTSPETGAGTLSATTLAVELGAGVAPRLGPGRLCADVAFGLSLTFVSTSSALTSALFQRQPGTATEPFGALRLGYAVDLPWGLVLEARAEERLNHQASFQIVGANFLAAGGASVVLTQGSTLQALGLLGYRFF